MKGKSIIIVVVLVLAGVGIYFAIKKAKDRKNENSTTDTKSGNSKAEEIPSKVTEHTPDFEVGEKFNYNGKIYQRTVDGWNLLA
jgi:uncharacterized protein (UPF0333 family)